MLNLEGGTVGYGRLRRRLARRCEWLGGYVQCIWLSEVQAGRSVSMLLAHHCVLLAFNLVAPFTDFSTEEDMAIANNEDFLRALGRKGCT